MTANFKPVAEQLAYLKKGVAEIVREDELRAKLEKSYKTGVPLRVYLGVDPTAPDIHLGHTVVLRKLKHFQDMGHTAVFLIGDFSAMIGDPTGRSETRPPLSREEVNANAKTYLDQVFKILDKDKTEVRYNSEWLDKLSSYEIVRLCGRYTVPRMLEREDFKTRLESGRAYEQQLRSAQDNQNVQANPWTSSPIQKPQTISIHELLYPLLTALDAVELKSDVELGATEQKFNLLVHRDIQREYGLEGQVCITMPILVGLDGSKKMSKSLGNYVGITETPTDIFGKIMSIPDSLMADYYTLLTDRSVAVDEMFGVTGHHGHDASAHTIDKILDRHPMERKMELAEMIVRDFHGAAAGKKAAENFQRVFRDRAAPTEVPVQRLKVGPPTQVATLVRITELAPSRSEAERLIKQGAVEIDGQRVTDIKQVVDVSSPREFVLRVGKKKFVRIVIVSQ